MWFSKWCFIYTHSCSRMLGNDNITRLKEPINEYCERGNIDLQTGYFAEKIFNEFSAKGKRLHKAPLASACLYVSCRKMGFHVQ